MGKEVELKWRYPPDLPQGGDRILTELDGCKIGKYFYYKVREGEGLGHIVKWVPLKEWENELWVPIGEKN